MRKLFGKADLLTLTIVFLLSPFAVQAADKKPPEQIGDGLVLKKDSKVDFAYVKPDVDWQKYKTIYIRQLSVTDEAKDATPKKKPSRKGHLGESWIIPEKDISLMQEEFTRIMKEALAKEGYQVVEQPQADTLVIVPVIIDIFLKAPIEESRKTHKSRGGTFTDGAGSMTVAASFADGEDLRVLAYAVDNKYPSSMWSRNTRIQNISDMRAVFKSWGKMLAKTLKKIQEK